MNPALRLPLPILLAALALPGCMVGPNFQRPVAPAGAGYTASPLPASAGGSMQAFEQGQDVPGRWWELYNSAALNRLMDQALKANPTLDAAKASLRAAHETTLATRGGLFPQADLGYDVTRQKLSSDLAPVLSDNSQLYTLHTAQVTVGYMPDVFGGVRRQTEAVAAQEDGQRFQAEAAYLTVTSSLVGAVVQAGALNDQIAETRAAAQAQRKALAMLQEQFRLGQAARGDVAAQAAAVAQTEQAIPPLEKQLAQQQDQIAALAGLTPAQLALEPIALSPFTLPEHLPVSLPSKLVDQRPDVRAAEAGLHAASAQVGVAIAARLPTFPLSAALGGSSSDLTTIFSNGNDFWTLGASIAQPVFRGGTLKHQQRAAEANLDQAKAQYRATVLAAFQNVGDSLTALAGDARALDAALAAEQATADGLAVAREQRTAGEGTALAVLAADQAHQQALTVVTQARAARLADTAALYQALGGGWWNRTEYLHTSIAMPFS